MKRVYIKLFDKDEHFSTFYNNHILYMSNINEFSNISETENFTCDNQEGLLLKNDSARIFLRINSRETWIDYGFLKEQRMKNIFIFCMYEAFLPNYEDKYFISEEIQNFFKAFAIEREQAYAAILDADEFDKIVRAGSNLEIKKINYKAVSEKERINNWINFNVEKFIFTKRPEYQYQNEVRIVAYCENNKSHIKYKIKCFDVLEKVFIDKNMNIGFLQTTEDNNDSFT